MQGCALGLLRDADSGLMQRAGRREAKQSIFGIVHDHDVDYSLCVLLRRVLLQREGSHQNDDVNTKRYVIDI